MKISKYNSIVFDCDGVLLNSNSIKTKAFGSIFKPYGKDIANKMVDYHIKNGGISRYKKIKYFIENYLKNSDYNKEEIELKMLNEFSKIVKNELLSSEVCDNLSLLKTSSKNTKWFIVSGGDQNELNYVFKKKKIATLFESGIFGSPSTKFEIIEREISNKKLIEPVLYFGDSKLDYEVARYFNFDFAFVYQWTEFKQWKEYFNNKDVIIISSPSSILTV